MLYLRILLSEVGGPKSISWTGYTTVTSSVSYVTFTSNGSRVGNVSSLWVRSGATPISDGIRGIMVIMVMCVIPGQGNSKILNLVKSGSFDSPFFLYTPNDEKTSTGHLI